MPMPSSKKTAAWAALVFLLALIFVLMQSRSRSSVPAAEGSDPVSRTASPSRSPKVDRNRVAAPGKRSFQEALELANERPARGLTAQQIHAFVNARNRSAESLLSAFRLGGEEAFLEEAMERFPGHPQVLMTSLSQEQDAEKRLAILKNLKRVDPNNALGNCLAARALLELGRKEEAFDELQKSVGKPVEDFTIASAQNDEEAYLAAGLTSAQAKLTALYGLNKPFVLQLRNLADGMAEMRKGFQAEGDGQSVESLRGIQSGLGQQLQGSGTLIDILVGMGLEKRAIEGVDSQEAQARLEELDQRKQSLTGRMSQVTELMKDPSVAEGDWLLYFDRAKLFGEAAANDWMLEKYPQP